MEGEMNLANGRQEPVNLHELFLKEISRLDGVPESEITPAYIEEQWEKKIYPHTKFDVGYSFPGLVFYTQNQLEKISNLADKLMASI
jgi:hypothetical protein